MHVHCSGHAAIGAADVLPATQDNNNKRHSVIDVNNVGGRSLVDVLPRVECVVMVDEGKVGVGEVVEEEEDREEVI